MCLAQISHTPHWCTWPNPHPTMWCLTRTCGPRAKSSLFVHCTVICHASLKTHSPCMVLIRLVDLGFAPSRQLPCCPCTRHILLEPSLTLMSANRATISKKRKVAPIYDGGHGVRYGHQSGIDGVCISNPFIHPLDLAASLDPTAPGHRKKHPHYSNITRAQFPAFEERSRRAAAARKAGEYWLICISIQADIQISPLYVSTASSC